MLLVNASLENISLHWINKQHAAVIRLEKWGHRCIHLWGDVSMEPPKCGWRMNYDCMGPKHERRGFGIVCILLSDVAVIPNQVGNVSIRLLDDPTLTANNVP
jgi:hypothetical protein